MALPSTKYDPEAEWGSDVEEAEPESPTHTFEFRPFTTALVPTTPMRIPTATPASASPVTPAARATRRRCPGAPRKPPPTVSLLALLGADAGSDLDLTPIRTPLPRLG